MRELIKELRLHNLVNSIDGVSEVIEIAESTVTTKSKIGEIRKFFANLNDAIDPIVLTPEILLASGIEQMLAFPSTIRYVHEFQNWYFWTHDKNEIKIIC